MCDDLNLTPERRKVITSLLSDYDLVFGTMGELTAADQHAVAKLILMPEWKALQKYYDNILFSLYKRIIHEGDINAAKKVISLTVAMRNRPIALKTSYDLQASKSSETNGVSETGFSEELKESGDEFR